MNPQESQGYTSMGRGARLKGILKVQQQEREQAEVGTLAKELESKAVVTEPEPEPVKSLPRLPVTARGKGGRGCALATNYLRLGFDEGRGLFGYKVTFVPPVDTRSVRFALLGQMKDTIGPNKMFDGQMLYIPHMLNEVDLIKQIPEAIEGQTYEAHFEFLGQKEVTDKASICLFNSAVRRIFKALTYSPIRSGVKEAFYNSAAGNLLTSHKLQIWPGYATEVQAFEGGVLLEVDTCSKVMHTDTALDIIRDLTKSRQSTYQDAVRKELIGSSVITKYNNRSYRISEIDFDSNPSSKFSTTSGETSFSDYYSSRYQAKITDEKQPMLVSMMRDRERPEKEEARVLLVPELCYVVGMSDRQREDFRVMKDVAAFTRLPPKEKERAMGALLASVAKCDTVSVFLKSWGINLAPRFLSLEGRVLDPETLLFGGGYSERVGPKVEWGRPATSKHAIRPMSLDKWVMLFTEKDGAAAKNFSRTLADACHRVGMKMAPPKPVALPNDRVETYIKAMREVDPEAQLVLTVVAVQKSDRYAAIKKLCYIERPMASQVVLLKNINNEKKAGPVAQKIALQLNCKLGGELWAVKTPFTGLMVIGIDVYREKGAVAYAGVVASMNDVSTRFFSSVVKHAGDGPSSLMNELCQEIKKAVSAYYQENKRWPSNIVVFRDGLLYSQLEDVAVKESVNFQDMLAKMVAEEGAGCFEPSLNYVVVQKRVNARMFTYAGGDVPKEGSFDNPPAGTVLDHTVTMRNYKDFFLVSQNVNHGTVSPTHFISASEAGAKSLSIDNVQKLAYQLTHMYYNWCGTVRVPAHVQYARKLVDMTGEHLRAVPHQSLSKKLFYL